MQTLAKSYGRIGGLDRLAAVVKRVRGERGNDKVLFSMAAIPGRARSARTRSKGQDMVDCMALLKPDAMTGHWEFTYGEARVKELIKTLDYPFLALNIRDTEWNEPAFEPMKMFEKGGVEDRGARAGLSLYAGRQSALDDAEMVVRYPRGRCARAMSKRRAKAGAQLVVLLSHNGFDVDRKLASRVTGIDVILTSHTHDALPEAIKVGNDIARGVGQPRQSSYRASTSMCRTARSKISATG